MSETAPIEPWMRKAAQYYGSNTDVLVQEIARAYYEEHPDKLPKHSTKEEHDDSVCVFPPGANSYVVRIWFGGNVGVHLPRSIAFELGEYCAEWLNAKIANEELYKDA